MSDASRPEEIRGRAFGQALRGYDRDKVDRFRDEVAGVVEALQQRIVELETSAGALGIEDAESLRAELATVGEDVAEVLTVAQKAAEGLRSRAAADAAAWRAEADKESRAARRSAQKDAEKARGDAWETATELLANTQKTVTDMQDQAAEDALFIRAEAEREALRLTGDARRDQEEIVRSARTEADRLVQTAHVEAEQILEAARHSADSAQERARALERRRSELMEELEAARLSIGQLEQEIDTRREALATAADSPESGVRVVPSDAYDWIDDDAGVRLVPGHVVPIDEPVDADSLVAEVEALQRAIDATVSDDEDTEPAPEPDATIEEPDADVGGEPPALDTEDEPDDLEAAAKAPGDTDDVSVDTRDDSLSEMDDRDDSHLAAESPPEPPREEPEPEAGEATPSAEPATPDPAESSERSQALDGLFARLRSPEPASPGPEPEPATDISESDAVVDPADEGVDAAEPQVDEDDRSEAETSPEPVAATSVDPFDLRDRMLLPIENRALRSVKRRIVDLQNRVLEELRVGGDDWIPDRALLAAAVGDEMATLVAESHVAGHTAAADLTGSTTTPRPEGGPRSGDSRQFVDAMASAVAEALNRARAAGGGSRQVSAAVSRVFRAWRTDEAERRLRQSARLAYHEGVVAGLEALGSARVMAVTVGQPCAGCPAGTGATWRPGHALPAGTSLPPVTADCNTTVVPAIS